MAKNFIRTKGKDFGSSFLWIFLILLLLFAYVQKDTIFGIKSDESSKENISEIVVEKGNYYSSCYDLCQAYDFSGGYDSITKTKLSCNLGESFASQINNNVDSDEFNLYCCCTPKPSEDDLHSNNCIDSDGGKDKDTPGHADYQGNSYYDDCLVGAAVKEYYCVDGMIQSENLACDYGETCVQTRSGGYCQISTPTWSEGDTVFSGGGSGVLISGNEENLAYLDLSDFGFEPDGNCLLGAQISTSWNYGQGECEGLQGMEGIIWKFYDSLGLEYQRTDYSLVGIGIDLHPTEHILEWDGTPWTASLEKTLNLPECEINYEYNIRVYIYSCN